jgi:hypothetical protein
MVAPFISMVGGRLGSTLHGVVNFFTHERSKIVVRFHVAHGVGR